MKHVGKPSNWTKLLTYRNHLAIVKCKALILSANRIRLPLTKSAIETHQDMYNFCLLLAGVSQ